MDEITISGRTVEEAIEAGLDALGAERSEVDVEVVDEGVKGILGLLGTRLARVRLVRRKPVKAVEAGHGLAGRAAMDGGAAGEEAEEGAPVEGARPKPAYRPATAEQVQRAAEFLRTVCRLMGVEGEVTHREVDGAVRLSVEGDQIGVLIGRRGQTLDALQYLVGLVANRNARTPSRFVVDVEGYRDRREATLRRLAHQTANKVKARGHRAVLEPMTPQERRVIHLALANEPGIYTYSEGEEPYRRVIIALRDDAGGVPGQPDEE